MTQEDRIELILNDPYGYARSLNFEQAMEILDGLGRTLPSKTEEQKMLPAQRRRHLRETGWL